MTLDFLDINGVSQLTTYSPSRIRELYRDHGLPAIRTGRRGEKVLFSRAAVEKWVLRRGRTRKEKAAPKGCNPAAPEDQQTPRA